MKRKPPKPEFRDWEVAVRFEFKRGKKIAIDTRWIMITSCPDKAATFFDEAIWVLGRTADFAPHKCGWKLSALEVG
jgi:hypothetical protein